MTNTPKAVNDNSTSWEEFVAKIRTFNGRAKLGLQRSLDTGRVHSLCAVEVSEAGWTTTSKKYPEATGGLRAAETITTLKPEVERMVRRYFNPQK